MFHRIAKLSFWLVAALFITLCPVAFQAQETAAPANTAKAKHSEITLTGCLQKGNSADEFAITGENGKTWELRSGTVKLAEHVGHTVTTLLRTGAGEPGRNYQSFFFLDGRPRQPEGGSSALRCRRGKKSGVQIAVGVEARFFYGCQSGSLWRERGGRPLL
jgi:hypothetical protein